MPANGSIEDMEKELDDLLELSHQAFVGKYAEQIDELLGLSRAENEGPRTAFRRSVSPCAAGSGV
jgi:hypothetical protein